MICLTQAVPCLDFLSPTCYFTWLTTIYPTGCCKKQVLLCCDPIASSSSFFIFNIFIGSIIVLQWCISFCCITKWISYTYTYIPITPPSCISLPHSLSHPSRWSQSTKPISLCYVAASHYISILYLVMYICPDHALTSSQLTLPPPRLLKSILYDRIYIPVLSLGSSEPFFFF